MGIITSILAAITYPLYYYSDFGIKIELLIILLFSISIALSGIGIYNFLSLHKKRPCLEMGLRLNVMAALVFAIAGSVKIALKIPLEGILVQGDQTLIYTLTGRTVLGILFLWKVLFGLGIVFMAIPGFTHPKTGKIIPSLGILFGLMIIILNFQAFLQSPEQMNLMGVGPFIPAWHLLVAILIALSGNWVNEKLSD